jgi:thiol-disulfide isomerase/thioredoxin
MNQLFNQYSAVLLGAGILVGGLVLLRLLRVRWRTAAALLSLVAVLLVFGWAMLRPNVADADSLQMAESLIQNGRPTFVEFYSQFCLGCVAARPQVDALVTEIANEFNILRVDIHTDLGRQLRQRYTFSYSPEFVLFNGSGEEVWRAHVPPLETELALAATSQSEGDNT